MIQILGFIKDFFNNIKFIYYNFKKPNINQELISKFEEFDLYLNSIKCILVQHKSYTWLFSLKKMQFFDTNDNSLFFDKEFPEFQIAYQKINPHLSKFMHWRYVKTINEKQIISLKNTRNLVITCNYNEIPCYNLSMLFNPLSTKVYVLQNIYNQFSDIHKQSIMRISFEQKFKTLDFDEALFKKCQQIAYSPKDLALYFVDKK